MQRGRGGDSSYPYKIAEYVFRPVLRPNVHRCAARHAVSVRHPEPRRIGWVGGAGSGAGRNAHIVDCVGSVGACKVAEIAVSSDRKLFNRVRSKRRDNGPCCRQGIHSVPEISYSCSGISHSWVEADALGAGDQGREEVARDRPASNCRIVDNIQDISSRVIRRACRDSCDIEGIRRIIPR